MPAPPRRRPQAAHGALLAARAFALACASASAAAAAPAAVTFDCGIRQLMLDFARSLQPSRRQADFDDMRASLSAASAAMPANNGTPCALTAPRAAAAAATAAAAASVAAGAAGSFFVSPSGSDAGTGSADNPFATIQRAVAATRALPPGARRAVELLAGTHFLNGSAVQLGAADSGLAVSSSAGAFVSGGTPLAGLAWSRAPPEGGRGRAWRATLGAAAFPSLPRVLGLRSALTGRRLPRARYPDVADLERDSVLDTGILAPPGAWRPGPHLQPARVLYPAYPFRSDFAIMQHYTLGFAAEGSGCAGFTPPYAFWCSNLTGRESNGTGFFSRPAGVSLNASMLPNLPYANVSGAVLQTWMSGRWFSVAFELDQALAQWDAASGVLNLSLASGGNQGSRGYSSGLDIAVENVLEELTADGEWIFNESTRELLLVGPAPPPDLALVALGPGSSTLVSLVGSQAAPVANVSFAGLGFTDAAITYLEERGVPSAGDWALARTGALFAEGVESLAVSACNFTALDNNALFLSGYSRGASVTDSAFTSLGESAIALWGRVGGEEAAGAPDFGWDTRNGDQPRFTLVARNLCARIGIWQKQSACLFQAEAALTTVEENIFFDLPRAAINDNELGMGGSVVQRNAAWSVCRETADHGVWNSWARTARVNDLMPDGRPGAPPSTTPLWTHARENLWIAQPFPRTKSGFAPGAQEAFDTDDGSAHVNVTGNVFVYGQSSLKSDLGGHDNLHDGNLLLFVQRGFGVDPGVLPGHADSFANNTVVFTQDGAIGGGQVCAAGPTRTRVLGNRYIMPTGNASECGMALRAWQALDPAQNDPGSVSEAYPPDLDAAAVKWARALLGLGGGGGGGSGGGG